MWVQPLLDELGVSQSKVTVPWVIILDQHIFLLIMFHARAKHIEVDNHFV
jgi:hypothetical protein